MIKFLISPKFSLIEHIGLSFALMVAMRTGIVPALFVVISAWALTHLTRVKS